MVRYEDILDKKGLQEFIGFQLKGLAMKCRAPVVASVRSGPPGEDDDYDDLYETAGMRPYRYVFSHADRVLKVHRDDYYRKDANPPGAAEIFILKNALGGTGRVMVKFDRKTGRFNDLYA